MERYGPMHPFAKVPEGLCTPTLIKKEKGTEALVTVADLLEGPFEESDLVEMNAALDLVIQQPGFTALQPGVQTAIKRKKNWLETWPVDKKSCQVAVLRHPALMNQLRSEAGVSMILRRCPEIVDQPPKPLFSTRTLAGSKISKLRLRYRFHYEGEYGVNHFQAPYWGGYDEQLGLIFIADIKKGTIETLRPDGTLAGVWANGLAAPRGFIINEEKDLLVCCHQSGQVVKVKANGEKQIFLDLNDHTHELGLCFYPMILQRFGQTLFFLLSSKDLHKRKVYIFEDGKWAEIPTEGIAVNFIRFHKRELFFNDTFSGRLFKYDHLLRKINRINLEPFQGAYYDFCFTKEAIYHLFNSQNRILVKSNRVGETIFRSICRNATKTSISHILSIQAVEMAGKMKLILSDAGRKSIHLIGI